MKTIYFVRHAKSSWDHPDLRDFERPLNERGQKDAPRMAKLFVAKGVKPDKLVSSPANRALTTATHFANAFGIPSDQILRNEDIYESMTATILTIIKNWDDDWQTVFIFGHNPTFTDVVNHLGGSHLLNIPTCGVCKVVSTAEKWADVKPENSKMVENFFPKEL